MAAISGAEIGEFERQLLNQSGKRRYSMDRLKALGSRLLETAKWQQMDTAPRDGTHVLLYVVMPSNWCKEHIVEAAYKVDGWRTTFGKFIPDQCITRWKPLGVIP